MLISTVPKLTFQLQFSVSNEKKTAAAPCWWWRKHGLGWKIALAWRSRTK
jgi:hypothetical protein